jgi:hypothetical protein
LNVLSETRSIEDLAKVVAERTTRAA